VQRIEEELLGTEAAWTKVDEAIRTSQELLNRQMGGAMRNMPGVPRSINRQSGQQEQPGRFAVIGTRRFNPETNRDERFERSSPIRSLFPWTWSAAVLFGMGVLSLCILTFRVRSLDRLR
jgi:hypothetical protein